MYVVDTTIHSKINTSKIVVWEYEMSVVEIMFDKVQYFCVQYFILLVCNLEISANLVLAASYEPL